MTVRNLRIREDTAKYLRNLDIESAHYDPKSRSMREAPDKDVRPEDVRRRRATELTAQAIFAGDNFARMTGEAGEALQQQLFACVRDADTELTAQVGLRSARAECARHGQPDASGARAQGVLGEARGAQGHDGDLDARQVRRRRVLEEAAGRAALGPDRELHRFVLAFRAALTRAEYSRTGQIIKGQERAKHKSKYDEDVFPGNHTSSA